MNCDQVRKVIDDFHYSELEERQAAAVADHLRRCDGCRSVLAQLEREAGIYEAYAARTESALDVPADLWKRAAEGAALSHRRVSALDARVRLAGWLGTLVPGSSWVRQAVAAVLLVAVSITGTLILVEHYHAKERAAFQQTNATAASPENTSLEGALKSIQRAEQEYLKAIHELSAVVEKQKSTLDPRIVAELQENLKLIDEHIAVTRKAYYAHPDDAELALHMLAAYSRKVELLQDLTS